MEPYLALQTLSWPDAILRVTLALVFGFCVGYERGCKSKPVDFRVYMIVATTTCLLAIMGAEVVQLNVATENTEFDHFRIVQGVVTGIGFLGAGTIIKSNGDSYVIGTATAASIWSSACMGLMLGFGLYGLALLGFAMLGIVLVLFGMLKKPLFNEKEEYTKPEDNS